MYLLCESRSGAPGDLTCLRRRQMFLECRELSILFQEPTFDEEAIGSACQRAEARHIVRMEGQIRGVDDTLAGGTDQRLLPQEFSQRHRPTRNRCEFGCRVGPAARCLLGLRKPRPDGQLECVQSRLMHIDAHSLLKSECQARDAMIEHGGLDREFRVFQRETNGPRRPVGPGESIPSAEGSFSNEPFLRPIGSKEGQVVRPLIEKIPCVGAQLGLHGIGQSRRPDNVHLLVAIEGQSEQAVEPAEMIHVHMRHENVRDAEDLTRRKRLQITQVEKNRPAAEAEIEQQKRVGKQFVYQTRLDEYGHGNIRKDFAISQNSEGTSLFRPEQFAATSSERFPSRELTLPSMVTGFRRILPWPDAISAATTTTRRFR